MKLFILTIIIPILFSRCTSIEQQNRQKFDKEYSIKGKEIMSECIIGDILMADTLIIAEIRSNNYYFAIYSPTSLKEIMKIARIGNGPDEFNNGLSYFGQCIKENNQIKIWVKGTNSNKMSLINLTKSIEKNKTVIEKEIKYKPEAEFSTVFFIDSTKIVGNTYMSIPDMYRLKIYNPETNSITKTVPLFPEVRNTNQNLNFIFYRYNYIYVSSLIMKNDKTKFVSVMCMFNRLDFFDSNGNLQYSYIDKDNVTKSQINDYLSSSDKHLRDLNIKHYYMDACSAGKYIYTLYYNQKKADYTKAVPVKIRIFNWEAEPVCEINVPDYLTTFTIDEKNGIMYGVAYFDEKILKYDIKDILDEIK